MRPVSEPSANLFSNATSLCKKSELQVVCNGLAAENTHGTTTFPLVA